MLNRRGIQIALLLLPIVPVVAFVVPFEIRLPVLDQWGLIAFFERFASGDLDLPSLYSWHNETHRMIFPRLAFIFMAFASGWSIGLELFANLVLVTIGLGALLSISRAHMGRPARPFLFAGLLCGLVAFSLGQWFNWQWGFAVSVFMVDTSLCVSVLLVVTAKPERPLARLLPAALLCLVASYSMAAGLLTWLAMLPVVLVLGQRAGSLRRLTLLWLALTALCWASYFMYGTPVIEGPSLLTRLQQDPIAHALYYFGILGAPASSGYQEQLGLPMRALAPAGVLITAIFLGLLLSAWRARDRLDLERIAPWASLGLFSLLYAGANMLGRAKPGMPGAPIDPILQRYISMYAAPASLLTIASIQLALLLGWASSPMALRGAPRGGGPSPPPRHAKRWVSGLALLATLVLLGNLAASTDRAFSRRPSQLAGYEDDTFCLEIRHFLVSPNLCSFDGTIAAPMLDTLERLEFRVPISSITFDEHGGEAWGTLESIRVERRSYVFSGRLTRRALSLPRFAILLGEAGRQRFFSFMLIRPVQTEAGHAGARFELSARHHIVPKGAAGVSAWIFDRERNHATRLAGAPDFKVPRAASARRGKGRGERAR